MFEKEADKYVKVFTDRSHIWSNDKLMQLQLREAYKDGAEFGYNKANEWHYVKDGLPQDNEYVLIYTNLKNTYVARIPTRKNYFITRSGGFIQMSAVIVWKEIVLPKEIEDE